MTSAAKTGIIETVAGNGEPGYAGDGGPAQAASLHEPKGLCLDREGNLYIADSENHVVRRVDRATGIITTVAGICPDGATEPASEQAAHLPIDGEEDPFADASADKANAYKQVTDLSGTVRYVTGGRLAVERDLGDGGPACQARLNFPSAVAVDRSGNLYIADTMNHRVRKVDGMSGVITTLAGTGQARFSGDGGPAVLAALNEPTGVAVNDDALYIADQSNNRVRMVQLATGVITTIAGDGQASYGGDQVPAVQAGLAGPSGVALGKDGLLLYVADTFSSRIRSVDPATGRIETAVGDGGTYRYQGPDEPHSQSLSRPAGIAVGPNGNLFITDSDSHLIRVWDRRTKTITRLSGTGIAQFGGDGGDALAGSLSYPFGVAVDAIGTVYIADTFNHRIRVLTPTA